MSPKEILDQFKYDGKSNEDFYNECIKPYVLKSPSITFLASEFEDICRWAVECWEPAVSKKYKSDLGSAIKRGMSYGFSETALERYWGLEPGSIFDRRIGETSDFDEPDLKKLGVPNFGIKASEAPNAPLISKNRCYYQIFCVHIIERGWPDSKATTYICGMADKDTIMNNLDARLTVDKDCKKLGFYGFDKLQPVPSLADLKSKWTSI